MVSGFLDMQALVGISKHMGGTGATKELLALCHADEAREALDVGCGIGAGLVALGQAGGCRVVGVDRSERMIDWARRRVREHGIDDRVELVVADATALPFADDRFDMAVAESVLAFVDDRAAAIREMARVVRPGGYVGFNESIWTTAPSPTTAALARDMGAEVEPVETWRSLCEQAGLRDIVVRLRRVDPATEVRNRMRQIGLPWMVRAWGRTARLYATRPSSRPAMKALLGPGLSALDNVGYGLFVGQV